MCSLDFSPALVSACRDRYLQGLLELRSSLLLPVTDASLLAPTLAMLADDPSEMGARIGVGFFFHGLGSLIGEFHFLKPRY